MVRARTEYKNTVRKFDFEIDRQESMKHINAKFKNADKEYWKLLKETVSQPKPKSLSANDFDNYFLSELTILKIHFFQPDDDILYFNERFLNSEIQLIFDELNDTITWRK